VVGREVLDSGGIDGRRRTGWSWELPCAGVPVLEGRELVLEFERETGGAGEGVRE